MPQAVSLLVTCEHGGNRVPPRYRPLFRGHEGLLQTHRGYNAGGLTLARELAGAMIRRLRRVAAIPSDGSA